MKIPQVIKNFLSSEKGVIALALLIGATVLVSIDKMAIAEWQSYSIWIFGIYTGGKSIQGAAANLAGKPVAGTAVVDSRTEDPADPGKADGPEAVKT